MKNKFIKKLIIFSSLSLILGAITGCQEKDPNDLAKKIIVAATSLEKTTQAYNRGIISGKYNKYKAIFNTAANEITDRAAYDKAMEESEKLLMQAFVDDPVTKSDGTVERIVDASILNNLAWVLSPSIMIDLYNNLAILAETSEAARWAEETVEGEDYRKYELFPKYAFKYEDYVDDGYASTYGTSRDKLKELMDHKVFNMNGDSGHLFVYHEDNEGNISAYKDADKKVPTEIDFSSGDGGINKNHTICEIGLTNTNKGIIDFTGGRHSFSYTITNSATGSSRSGDSDEDIKKFEDELNEALERLGGVTLGQRYAVIKYSKQTSESHMSTAMTEEVTTTINFNLEGKLIPYYTYNTTLLKAAGIISEVKGASSTVAANMEAQARTAIDSYNGIMSEANKETLLDSTRNKISGFPTATGQHEETSGGYNTNTRVDYYDFQYRDFANISLTEFKKLVSDYEALKESSTNQKKIGDKIIDSGFLTPDPDGKAMQTSENGQGLFRSTNAKKQIDLLNIETILKGIANPNEGVDYNVSGALGNDFIFMYANIPLAGLRLYEVDSNLRGKLSDAESDNERQGFMVISGTKQTILAKTFVDILYVSGISANGQFYVSSSRMAYNFKTGLFYKLKNEGDYFEYSDNLTEDERQQLSEWYKLDSSFFQGKPGTMVCIQYEPLYSESTINEGEYLPIGRKLFLNKDIMSYDSFDETYSFTSLDAPFAYLADPSSNQWIEKGTGFGLTLGSICSPDGKTLEGFESISSSSGSNEPYDSGIPDEIFSAD